MPDLSYCQFQNTEDDLAYCVETLEAADRDLSSAEQAAAFRMVALCERFIAAHKNYTPLDEEEEDE